MAPCSIASNTDCESELASSSEPLSSLPYWLVCARKSAPSDCLSLAHWARVTST